MAQIKPLVRLAERPRPTRGSRPRGAGRSGRWLTADRLVGVDAVRTAAVGDDRSIRRQVLQMLLELSGWHADGAGDVPGVVLDRRSHGEHDDVPRL